MYARANVCVSVYLSVCVCVRVFVCVGVAYLCLCVCKRSGESELRDSQSTGLESTSLTCQIRAKVVV